MKLSESWLREWVDPDLDSAALAHRLTMLGLEVDSVRPVAEPVTGVVVGEVLTVNPHPNADRLRLCQVEAGEAEPLSIVCGAPNVQAGHRYPVALVGAKLPGGMKIRPSKIRGEKSEGMLCSAVELGLGEESDGILDLESGEIGEPIATALDLEDCVIDIDLTPNRADCFSVMGIARDLAAAQNLPISHPKINDHPTTAETVLPVTIEAAAGCGRFVGRAVEGINPAARTPLWMQERLRRGGIRPIYPAVDVTNYVMLELGQPLHGYDLNRLTGGIVVRRAAADEALTLLVGTEVKLDPEVLVIADDSGAIGMAGIMGGESTAVSAATTNVFLEAAYFTPDVIAGRARRFGMHTDASMRFERGVDPAGQARAIERATMLLCEIAGGKAGPLVECEDRAEIPVRAPIKLRRQRLKTLLGVEIPDAEVEAIFDRLGMTVAAEDDGWIVTPPSARFDISIEVDLIEEVVRLHGYDQIPEIVGRFSAVLGTATETAVPVARVRASLAANGYQEVITYSFVDPALDDAFGPSEDAGAAGLALSNPISSELAVMRRSLWPGLVQAAKHNLSRQQGRLRLFEFGIRFLRQDTDIIEENVLSGLLAGSVDPEQWSLPARTVDLFDLKADLQSVLGLTGAIAEFEFAAADHPALRPGRSAAIKRSGKLIGWMGEMHPALIRKFDLGQTPVLFEIRFDAAFASAVREFQPVSKFPTVRRDLAVIVDSGLPVSDLVQVVNAAGGPRLRETRVFDIYTGENIETGSKSVALGLILQETSRTLTEDDVGAIIQAVIERLSHEFNATIRE
jgi:phenylalanyl-tRNA synthetase beta chain